jgi:hypothetical protein
MRGRNEKRQAQKTSPRKTKKGEAKIAVKQADKKRLVFLLGFVGKQQIYKKQQICDFGYIDLWNFSTAQSPYYRRLLLHLVQVLASGEQSTFWKVTATIIVRHVRK